MIASDKAVEILRKQVAIARELRGKKRFSSEFETWYRNTEIALEKIFGKETRHTNDFDSVGYALEVTWSGTPDYEHTVAFQQGLDTACARLESMIQEIEDYGLVDIIASEQNPVSILRTVCNRFHNVAKQLRARRDD